MRVCGRYFLLKSTFISPRKTTIHEKCEPFVEQLTTEPMHNHERFIKAKPTGDKSSAACRP